MGWNIGDTFPFCLLPETFQTSMESSEIPIDREKFAGKWFEVARKPTSFQGGCVCSDSDFDLTKDKSELYINNKCYKTDGKQSVTGAKAKFTNEENTKLRIDTELPIKGHFWVLDRDPNYQWALVGEPCKNFLWVFSRNKNIDDKALDARIQKAKDLGYNVDDIVYRPDIEIC